MDILHHTSFTLSPRSHILGDVNDLDEEIRHRRTVYYTASRDSSRFQLALNNLASQIRRKFEQNEDDAYLQRSVDLMKQLLSCTTPVTTEHAVARGQLFHFSYRKGLDTQSLESIDEAVALGKRAFDALPKGSDAEIELLKMIVDIFARRNDLKSDKSDFHEFVHYSGLLIEAIPGSHSSRDPSLVKYLKKVGQYASADPSLASLEPAINQTEIALSMMLADFPHQESCQYMISNLLGTRYSASNPLRHISDLVDYVENMMVEHNETAKISETAESQLESKWISIFNCQLKRLQLVKT